MSEAKKVMAQDVKEAIDESKVEVKTPDDIIDRLKKAKISSGDIKEIDKAVSILKDKQQDNIVKLLKASGYTTKDLFPVTNILVDIDDAITLLIKE